MRICECVRVFVPACVRVFVPACVRACICTAIVAGIPHTGEGMHTFNAANKI